MKKRPQSNNFGVSNPPAMIGSNKVQLMVPDQSFLQMQTNKALISSGDGLFYRPDRLPVRPETSTGT